jgi:addiction module HigA family antidote
MQMFNPPHPGGIVKRELAELSCSITKFAAHIGVSRVALSRVLNGRAGITPLMSLKFSEAFGQGSSDIWFRMQNEYDFWQASQAKRKKVRPLKFASDDLAA